MGEIKTFFFLYSFRSEYSSLKYCVKGKKSLKKTLKNERQDETGKEQQLKTIQDRKFPLTIINRKQYFLSNTAKEKGKMNLGKAYD